MASKPSFAEADSDEETAASYALAWRCPVPDSEAEEPVPVLMLSRREHGDSPESRSS